MVCSFCGKDSNSVDMLVTGPEVAICDACIKLCEEIRQEHRIRTMWDSALEYAFLELWGTDT